METENVREAYKHVDDDRSMGNIFQRMITNHNGEGDLNAFVSCPMNGLEEDEVRYTQTTALNLLNDFTKNYLRLDVRFKLLETYLKENVPNGAGRAWFLGDSIKLMDQADIVIFAGKWKKANGCKIEKKVCKLYGIPYLSIKTISMFMP